MCRNPTPTGAVCAATSSPLRVSARAFAPFVRSISTLAEPSGARRTIRPARFSVNRRPPSGCGSGPSVPSKPSRTRTIGVPAATTPSMAGVTEGSAAASLPAASPAMATLRNKDLSMVRLPRRRWDRLTPLSTHQRSGAVMKLRTKIALSLLTLGATPMALAALGVGGKAPDFSARASLDGKAFDFSLKEALKKGPVVVYFYPSAYTGGCNLQAHTFALNHDKFAAAHATIIGVSLDSIERLNKFSADPEYCAGKVPVASDPDGKIAKSYDLMV